MRDVTVSRWYAADADTVWGALVRPATEQLGTDVIALPTQDVALRREAPGDGAAGPAVWDGVRYRLSAHLVGAGEATTLVLSARRRLEPRGRRDGTRFARSRRHARRDLRRVVDAVASAVGSAPPAP